MDSLSGSQEFQCIQNMMDKMISDIIFQESHSDEVFEITQEDTESMLYSPFRKHQLAQCCNFVQSHSEDEHTTTKQVLADALYDTEPEKESLNCTHGAITNMKEEPSGTDYIHSSCPILRNKNCLLSESEKSFLVFLDDMQNLTTKEKTNSEKKCCSISNLNLKSRDQWLPSAVDNLHVLEQTQETSGFPPLQSLLKCQESRDHTLSVSQSGVESEGVTIASKIELTSLCKRIVEDCNTRYFPKNRTDTGTDITSSTEIVSHGNKLFSKEIKCKEPLNSVMEKCIETVVNLYGNMERKKKFADPEFLNQEVNGVDINTNNHEQNVYPTTDRDSTNCSIHTTTDMPVLEKDGMTDVKENSCVTTQTDIQILKKLDTAEIYTDFDDKKYLENLQNYPCRDTLISLADNKYQQDASGSKVDVEPSSEEEMHQKTNLVSAAGIEAISDVHRMGYPFRKGKIEQRENVGAQIIACPSRPMLPEQTAAHIMPGNIVITTCEQNVQENESIILQKDYPKPSISERDLRNPDVSMVVSKKKGDDQTVHESTCKDLEMKTPIQKSTDLMNTFVFQKEMMKKEDQINLANNCCSYQVNADLCMVTEQKDALKYESDLKAVEIDKEEDNVSSIYVDESNPNNLTPNAAIITESSFDIIHSDELLIKPSKHQLLGQPHDNMTAQTVPDVRVKITLTDNVPYAGELSTTNVKKEQNYKMINNHSTIPISCNADQKCVQDQLVPDEVYVAQHGDRLISQAEERSPVHSEPDESLYYNEENMQKESRWPASNFKWKYRPSCDGEDEDLITPPGEMEPLLGSIQPLITGNCNRSLRIGLSRKQKVKRLHKHVS